MAAQSQITHHIGPRAFGWCSMAFTELPDTRTWQHGYINQDGRWVDESSVDRADVVSAFHSDENRAALRRGIRNGGMIMFAVAVVAAIVWGVL